MGGQTSSGSDLGVVDSDGNTASGDCVSCSDTNGASVRTSHKKYHKRVHASCKSGKGSDCTEAQLKRINDSWQDVWGHVLAIIRSEQTHALEEDQESFKMQKTAVQMDQLLCITEAIVPKFYHHESETEMERRERKLVLSLKQYYTQFYHFYEKGSTRATVCLQGFHSGDAFHCSNVAASMGLKSFCPWCFKLVGTPKQEPPTCGRYTTDWPSHAIYADHLPVCLCRWS